MSSSLTLHSVSFAWPDGTDVLRDIDVSFGPGVTGIVGDNGAGKSTMLRLITGDLVPTAGTVTATGRVGHLPQDLVFHRSTTVAEALGVHDVVRALWAIEGGVADAELLDVVGDDWLVEERCAAQLDRLGLPGVSLDRPLGDLSGGECMLVGLAGVLLDQPDIILMDEPTNNLDAVHRSLVVDAIGGFRGCLLVVSHDRDLLGRADTICEVGRRGVRTMAGDLDHFESVIAEERAVAERGLRDARGDLRRQVREQREALVKLDRRQRYGRTAFEQKRQPGVIMQKMKRDAQVSAGKLRDQHDGDVADARARVDEARDSVQEASRIRIELPDTEVHASARVLEMQDAQLLYGPAVTLELVGPERVGIVGRNGSGKTTLLRTIAGEVGLDSGTCSVHLPVGHLPQRHELLDDAASVLDNVRRHAPGRTGNELRAQLARLMFRAGDVDAPVASLSGGERFRAALATVLLAEPAPRLLLLDEPSNNLDFASVDVLVDAVEAFRGALIVVSHDRHLLDRLGLDRVVSLDPQDPQG